MTGRRRGLGSVPDLDAILADPRDDVALARRLANLEDWDLGQSVAAQLLLIKLVQRIEKLEAENRRLRGEGPAGG